jgi:hypothetical protein
MVPTLARQIDEAWNRYMMTVEMRAPPAVATVSTYVDDGESDDGYDSDELLYGEHDYSDVLGPPASATTATTDPAADVDAKDAESKGIDDVDGGKTEEVGEGALTEVPDPSADQSLVPYEPPAPPPVPYTYHPHVDEDYKPHGHYDFVIDPKSKHGLNHNFPHLDDAEYMSLKTKNGQAIKKKSKSRKDRIDFSKQENIRDVATPAVSGLDVSKVHGNSEEKDSVSDLMRRMQIVQAKQAAREKHRQEIEQKRDPAEVVKSFTDWVKR